MAPMESSRGSALVMAIFVLALVAGIGIALLFLTHNELKMSRASVDIKQAFYIAEAGIEDGRRTLFDNNGSGGFADDLLAAAGPDGRIDLDAGALRPQYDGAGRLTGFTGAGDDVPLRGITPVGEGFYAAFLSNDPLELAGRSDLVDTNDRVMVTAVGVIPGGAMEIAEAILEPQPILPVLPPAALTLWGEAPHFESGTSSTSEMVGNDCVGGGNVPIVGAMSDAAEAAVELGYYKEDKKDGNDNGPELHSGGFALDDQESTFANLTDDTEPTLAGSGPIDPAWLDCPNVKALAEKFRSRADYFCDNPDGCAPPPAGFVYEPDSVVFIDGDVSISATDSGTGVLVVTGHLDFHGGASWNGLILVVGEGSMLRNGGGSGLIAGAVYVADVAGPDGSYGNDDDCTGTPDGFGESSYVVNGGGNANIAYCSSLTDLANAPETYDVAEFLQH